MHSTDRLKYHLRTTPHCLHGLRVTVGEAYVYGSGTKRTGRRGHVGLPPVRMIGPQNATPAQRKASLEGRECTAQELRDELYAAAAVYDVHAWPGDLPDHLGDSAQAIESPLTAHRPQHADLPRDIPILPEASHRDSFRHTADG